MGEVASGAVLGTGLLREAKPELSVCDSGLDVLGCIMCLHVATEADDHLI